MKSKTLWKSLSANLTSYGGFKWEVGKWYKCKGKPIACRNGFHASKRAIDAMRYVNCEHLALVEVKGKSDTSEKDKEAWEQMRLVKVYNWKKEDSVALAIYAAELVIDEYEKKYPQDKRPREAIEAAKTWLTNPTEENRQAAEAAAWAAMAAAWAAMAAAWAAAWAAAMAAAYAADEKVLNKCEGYILKEIVPTLEVIKL